MVPLEDLKKKFRIFYKGLNSQNKIGIFIITIGVVFLILGLVFIPLLNSDRIWKKYRNNYSFLLPQNDLIGNKYEIIVFHTFTDLADSILEGTINFTHIKSGRQYFFDFSFHSFGMYIETLKKKQTFTMLPGSYNLTINLIYGLTCDCEVWEKGIIPQGIDWVVYLGFSIGSILIIIKGYKKYYGKVPEKLVKRRKYICQNCGAKLTPGYAICLKCGENV